MAAPGGERSRVALTGGEDHADIIVQGLARLKDAIARAIGEAGNVVIAESAANGPTFVGYASYGYELLARKCGARLVDLDRESAATVRVVYRRTCGPTRCGSQSCCWIGASSSPRLGSSRPTTVWSRHSR